MSHPVKIYKGVMFYSNEEIRYIDSNYRVTYNDRDEILGGIVVGTNVYDIWLRVEDVAELIEW